MKIVVIGTGAFGVPTFEALYRTPYEIAALVTQPKPETRRPLPTPEMVQLAEAHGTPIHTFADIKSPEAVAALWNFHADLFFICDYGQILSQEGIRAARLGGLNLHGSLLPKYRGAAPVNWALYHGDKTAGITVIYITPEVDAGPMIASASLEVGPDETAPELEKRLARLGAPCVVQAVDELARDEAVQNHAVPQDASLACGAPKLKRRHSTIDWSQSAQQIHNQIRALEPWPRTITFWKKSPDKPALRLIPLPKTQVLDGPANEVPGTVLAVGETLQVATGDGILAISHLQPSGKKALTLPEFLCGNPMRVGDRLFSEE